MSKTLLILCHYVSSSCLASFVSHPIQLVWVCCEFDRHRSQIVRCCPSNALPAIFSAHGYTSLLLLAVMSARLSVCPSHSRSTPKRYKISKHILHFTIELFFYFPEAKFYVPEFRGLPPNECVKERHLEWPWTV